MVSFGTLVAALCTGSALAAAARPVDFGLSFGAADGTAGDGGLPGGLRQLRGSHIQEHRVSTAACAVVSDSATAAQSASVAATLGSSVASFVCDPEGFLLDLTAQADGRAVAAAEARGFARAVANISVDCYLEGNTNVRINGETMAVAQATLMAELFVENVARAEVCGQCASEIRFFARRSAETLVRAVARAEVAVLESTTGTESREVVVREFVDTVEEGAVRVVGAILTNAAADLGNTCRIVSNVTGEFDSNTADDAPPEGLRCQLSSSTERAAVRENGVANATRAIAVFACEDPSEDQATAAGTALATVAAAVTARLTQDCALGAGAISCAFAFANASQTFSTLAVAFANGTAEAISTCAPPLCAEAATDTAFAFETIIADAVTTAVSDVCADATGAFDVDTVRGAVVARSAQAFARVLVSATVDGANCTLNATVAAGVTPTQDVPAPPLPTAASAVPPALPPATPVVSTIATGEFTSTSGLSQDSAGVTPEIPDGSAASASADANSTFTLLVDVNCLGSLCP